MLAQTVLKNNCQYVYYMQNNDIYLTIIYESKGESYMIHNKFKGLALLSVTALFANSQVMAHTGVRDAVEQGKSSYNGFTISHGCGDNTQAGTAGADQYPVIGQAALFPYGPDAIWREDGGRPVGYGLNNPALVNGVNGFTIPVSGDFNLSVDSVAGAASPFSSVREIVDSLGVTRALVMSNGGLEPKLRATPPFYVKAPVITDNCVSAIKVRVAVINYCDIGKNATNDDAHGEYAQPKDMFGRPIPITYASTLNGGLQANVYPNSPVYKAMPHGNGKDNRADWWFYGTNSTKYVDPDMLDDVTNAQYWTTLTINNSTANTSQCGGTLHALTVEPSGTDIDTYLSGPNTWPFSKGDSNL